MGSGYSGYSKGMIRGDTILTLLLLIEGMTQSRQSGPVSERLMVGRPDMISVNERGCGSQGRKERLGVV
ncbi:hypothetical protein N7456_004683 [Penicillium angulare]|uniref:Uncharacterized protein n=1 Tax=Penicillium angulare TaxID=116970 RepID=A0A9W9FX07_9EURO|nr:hypothetical protein N7456_004683 [Penicillium angulare]